MVAGIQGSRMNDQRADVAVFPGLVNQQEVIAPFVNNRKEDSVEDQFFEMLMRCQVGRKIVCVCVCVGYLISFAMDLSSLTTLTTIVFSMLKITRGLKILSCSAVYTCFGTV